MYDCKHYPGYDFVRREASAYPIACTEPKAYGWLVVPVFLFVVIFGSYVLPTVKLNATWVSM